MEWNNLKQMNCPKCSTKLSDASMGYKCTNCDFMISYEKFRTVINNMYTQKSKKYNPDTIDRSDW